MFAQKSLHEKAHPSIRDVPENNVIASVHNRLCLPHGKPELLSQLLKSDAVEKFPGNNGPVPLRILADDPLIDSILDLVALDLTDLVFLHLAPP